MHPQHAARRAKEDKYPVEYSLVEITYVDGTTTSFMVKASPNIAKYLRDELKETQALTLRNDTDVMVIAREQLRSFTLRAMTKE
jgi:DNA-binding IclR family transcriptional regulator